MKSVVAAAQRRVIFDKNTLRDMEFRNEKKYHSSESYKTVERKITEKKNKRGHIQITLRPKEGSKWKRKSLKVSSVELEFVQKRNTPGPKKNCYRAIIIEI